LKQIAIIPARGGSKRLPRKNILPIKGMPLLNFPIEAAKKSGLFDDVVVSTEDDEIANIAKEAEASVINRPLSLAQDRSTVVEVCQHVLSLPDYETLDSFCCIYPTAVYLDPNDLIESRSLLDSEVGVDFVMGVSRYNYPPVQALVNKNGYLQYMWPEFSKVQSQFYPELLVSNGTLYWARFAQFQKEGTFYGERLVGYEIHHEKTVDINTAAEYEYVKADIENWDR
jgi:CMP-N-acetylneuraminic acid synthetase